MQEEKRILRSHLVLKYNKYTFILFIILTGQIGFGQECRLSISGRVIDSGTGDALEFAHIHFQGKEFGAITDEQGKFQIKELCPGSYHLDVSHIGCQTQKVFLDLVQDTTLEVVLNHSSSEIAGIVVQGEKFSSAHQSISVLGEKEIMEQLDRSLGQLLQSTMGVSAIQTGGGVSKPVIHGLYGNRLTILNNYIPQSGQQWGNDHAPEVDPLVAQRIQIIKGASVIEYMGSNLGGLVIVEPDRIVEEPHLHGSARYHYNTNGRGHGVNMKLNQYKNNWGWSFIGTVKKRGDQHSPDYFLNNTGMQEYNVAIQFTRRMRNNIRFNFYASSFNSTIGILRGSHIGNISDLKEAFNRQEPFFTESKFSYQIEAPRQEVGHHLIKSHIRITRSSETWFDLTLAGQWNDREEYDVRRGGRTNTPSLSLRKYSIFSEAKLRHKLWQDWSLKSGVQFVSSDNENNPETGILPLIPDHDEVQTGVFILLQRVTSSNNLVMGVRYDHVFQKVALIGNAIPRDILRFENHFNNINLSASYNQELCERTNIKLNIGFATRNPAINELYSSGLHQGVSGIEEGTTGLLPEKGIKGVFEINSTRLEKFDFRALAFYHNIRNYIFLNPQNEFRLTIRGAFPVFLYDQTNAAIFGSEIFFRYEPMNTVITELGYSYTKGNDLDRDIPLVFMPQNTLRAKVNYFLKSSLDLEKFHVENTELGITYEYTFEQNHLNEDQDFLSPPKGYSLIGISTAVEIPSKLGIIRVSARCTNLLNNNFRNYLNRQRYFSDDIGRDVVIGMGIKF